MCGCRLLSQNSSCVMIGKVRNVTYWFAVVTCCLCLFTSGQAHGADEAPNPEPEAEEFSVCTALINVTYKDPSSGILCLEGTPGMYGAASRILPEVGKVVHVKSEDGANHGCSPPVNIPIKDHWIALVQRGGCKFHQKVYNAAVLHNASAVVIYNHKEEEDLITMRHGVDDVVSVFIAKQQGDQIARLVDRGLEVKMNISVGQITIYNVMSSNSTEPAMAGLQVSPFVIVSLSLIFLLICALGALLIYGIRKSRRNSNHKNNRARNLIFTLQPDGKIGKVQESLLSAEQRSSPGPGAAFRV